MITIENEYLKAGINTLGAELKSLTPKKSPTQLIWQGDTDSWTGSAPNLFPFIGRLKNGTYQHNGKEYALQTHGFARNSQFEIIEHKSDSVTFCLQDSQNTLKVYPFKFKLLISYTVDKERLIVTYTVENVNQTDMYFGIGGHTGFNLPFKAQKDQDTIDGNTLVFEKTENPKKYEFDKKEILITDVKSCAEIKEIALTKSVFADDAILLADIKSNYTDIVRADGINIRFWHYNCPYLAFWTHAKRGGYVCIEPWWGLPDYFIQKTELSQKVGICTLNAAKVFTCSYDIQLLHE